MLVCEHFAGRCAIARNGIARYVPVYPDLAGALAALSVTDSARPRLHAKASLPARESSLPRSRELVEEWLTAWSQIDLIPVSKVIVTALV